jgi:ABC-type polysaccharide/polyol phosphate transport system ATPase subunit
MAILESADAESPPEPMSGRENGHTGAPAPSLRVAAKQREKVIKFSHVSKRFTLHLERPRSFQEMVVSLFGLRTLSRRGVALPQPARQDFWALKDVNFSIYGGEVVGIIGENGSGKSTTLKLISRILRPTSGGVSVKGKVSALLELGAGFHPDLTGRENIFLNGSLLGLSKREMDARLDQIVEFSELAEFIDTPIKHYSSGMTMRLGFAVAVHVDPDILLTDEVLAVGDEAFQRKCLDHISELRRRGVTIIFVSHALEAVRALCRRVIWLDHGRVIADGPAGQVIDKYLAYENAKDAERVRAEHSGTQPHRIAAPEAMIPVEEDEVGVETTAVGQDAGIDPFNIPTTGRASIEDVTFRDAQGNRKSVFQTGEDLTIEIHYRADEPLLDPTFGLALFTENGTQINGPNTRFAGFTIPRIEGSGQVNYTIPALPLLAGRYDVTAAVTGPDLTDIHDHKHQIASFSVQPTPDLPERWGVVYMPSRWDHQAGSTHQGK